MNFIQRLARQAIERYKGGVSTPAVGTLPPPGPLSQITHAPRGSQPRYIRRHLRGGVDRLHTRRGRREIARSVRLARARGLA